MQLQAAEADVPEGGLAGVPGDPVADRPEPRPADRAGAEGARISASSVTDKQVEDQLKQLKKQYFGGRREEVPGGAEEAVRHRRRGARATSGRTSLGRDLQEGDGVGDTVTDAEVKDYYTHTTAVYTQPQIRVVRHILVKDKATADKLYGQLKADRRLRASPRWRRSTRPGSRLEGAGRPADDPKGQTVPAVRQGRVRAQDRRALEAGQDAVRLAHHPGDEADHSRARRRPSRRSRRRSSSSCSSSSGATTLQKWLDDVKKRVRREDLVRGGLRARRRRTAVDDDRLSLGLAEALLDLQRLTERLRRDCPWDREQTARTIVPHTVEEAYEVADAALAGDPREAARRARRPPLPGLLPGPAPRRAGRTATWRRSRAAVHEKLVRRHPHVFGDVEADDAPARPRALGADQARAGGAGGRSSTTCPAALPGAPPRPQGAAPGGLGRLRVPGRRRGARRPRGRARRAEGASSTGGTERAARRGARRPAVRLRERRPASRASTPSSSCAARAPGSSRASRQAARLAGQAGEIGLALPLAEQDRYFDLAKEHETMTAIADVHARQILDSRGNPTVEVDVRPRIGSARAAPPSPPAPRPAPTRRSSCATAAPRTAARA